LRRFSLALIALGAVFAAALAVAQTTAQSPPLELVKFHVDVELEADGSYTETREIVYRLLTEASVQSLRQATMSYTDGYQQLGIQSAYTLKANGTRIDVPQNSILSGYGASSSPGFEDVKTLQVFFPNVEVGDEIAITTVFRQDKPWFPGQFAQDFVFSPLMVTRDGSISITAPASLALQFENLGLEGGDAETADGKIRRTWRYHNDTAVLDESNVVSPLDTGPRLSISTFTGYAQIAEEYRRMMHAKADVTPAVQAQADQLVAGISDRREQARAIYDWVSAHIAYVDIVLGAGGFVPHAAPEILQTKYGDCKDHAVLLESLLAAEGIVSNPILIEATNRYTLPKAPSPFTFNHMINYLPEFKLFVDSTERYAPFGTLPPGDTDKPVLNVMSGQVDHTPAIAADQSKVRAVETVTIARDGTADGDTRVTAYGPGAMAAREVFQLINNSNEGDFFRSVLGPGASATLDKGDIASLSDPYTYDVHFHIANAANMPGPAAISTDIGYKAVGFIPLIGGDLPPARTLPYVCHSFSAEDDLTLIFPAGIKITTVPDSPTIKAEGIALDMEYDRPAPNTLHVLTRLRIDHPGATCDSAYYARVRPKLAQMITALRGQIIYRLRDSK
jgi:transglutaminase-like putative cysteine protease